MALEEIVRGYLEVYYLLASFVAAQQQNRLVDRLSDNSGRDTTKSKH